jgi:hypothetical protein
VRKAGKNLVVELTPFQPSDPKRCPEHDGLVPAARVVRIKRIVHQLRVWDDSLGGAGQRLADLRLSGHLARTASEARGAHRQGAGRAAVAGGTYQ